MNADAEASSILRLNLQAQLAQLAQILPAQPPLRLFAYQNPLQKYLHLPFQTALATASSNGGNGYLSEVSYRSAYLQGRITDADIEAALAQDGRLQAHDILLPTQPPITKADVYRLAMLFEVEPVLPSQLAWQIEELNTLERFQPDVPVAVRQRILGTHADAMAEKTLISNLWHTLLNKLDLEQTYLHPENMLDLSLDQAEALLAQHRASQRKVSLKKNSMQERMQDAAVKAFANELERLGTDMSLRNLMMDLCGVDILDNVRPQMIRLCSSGLDEGMASWPLPARHEIGFYAAWRAVAKLDINPFLQELPDWQAIMAELPDNPEEAIILQLTHLEIPQAQWDGYLRCLALEMPGWSSLINWRTQHPEYSPENDAKPTLADYLAIRLTLDRLWLNQICRDTWQIEATLSSLKNYFRKHASEYMVRWHLFRGNLPEYLIQQAEALTLNMNKEEYSRSEWQNLADVIWTWQGSSMINSRPLHSIYDSAWQLFRLCQHLGLSAEHLHAVTKQELEQTLHILNEFTVARRCHSWLVAYERHYRELLLQGLQAQHHDSPETPAAVQVVFSLDNRAESIRRFLEANDLNIDTFGVSSFSIDEVSAQQALTVETPLRHSQWQVQQILGRLWHHTLRDSLLLSSLLMVFVFPMVCVGLLLKVFFPCCLQRLWPWKQKRGLEADVQQPVVSPETVERFARLMQTMGLARHFSPLVVFMGQTVSTQNHNHFAAYTVETAGMQQAGAVAAALAAFANLAEVRQLLAERGIEIPAETCFVGAEYDCTREHISWFGIETQTEASTQLLEKLKAASAKALQQVAKERCREFVFAPRKPNGKSALRYIQSRAADFAEPRPDSAYALANAALIGRRKNTQGLKLDRSAFLVSYDATQDSDGQLLEMLLLNLMPKFVALSMSYYFATVDNASFGSGNSILHNVIGQLGVMEGTNADLRHGLPRQMVQRHAAMRLQVVVETKTQLLQAILERQPALRQFIDHQWIYITTQDPDSGELFNFNDTQHFSVWAFDDCPLSTFVFETPVKAQVVLNG